MIKLRNGTEFKYKTGAGALGYDGQGWPWEKPLVWFNVIRPEEFAITTKTLTMFPRRGNLRWWCPWRAVRLYRGGAVNAVGLTNPGLPYWIAHYYPRTRGKYCTIVSIAPEDETDTKQMAVLLDALEIQAIELNLSCPNTTLDQKPNVFTHLIQTARKHTNKPLIVKFGYSDPYKDVIMETASSIDAVELINSIPWKLINSGTSSPLEKYGYDGAISGPEIKYYARTVLRDTVETVGDRTQIIAGGGIDSLDEVRWRLENGAKGVSFSTLFLTNPTLPNKIIKELEGGAKLLPTLTT